MALLMWRVIQLLLAGHWGTTAPRSPESNGMAEAFVKTFKRDYVTFGNLESAQVVLEQLPEWFEDYNEKAPHKGLKMLSPRQYLLQMKAAYV